jgi:hypothetical protein
MTKGAWLAAWTCSIAMLGVPIHATAKNAGSLLEAIAIPGTGVTMALPDGVAIAPLSTNYTDDAQDVLIAISIGPAFRNLSAFPRVRALYPDPVESFRSSTLNGSLYKRTRSESGGTWDGWLLEVTKGDQVLDLKIYYSGSNPEKFPELKKYLSTASWNEKVVDSEIAFGLKLEIPSLRVVRGGAGALMYNQDGRPYPGAQYILLNTAPVNFHGDISKFHEVCKSIAPTFMHGQPISIRYEKRNKINICDAWEAMTPTGREYFAALMLPDGSLAQAHGHGDPDTFQQALLGAQIIPRSPSKPQ